MSRSAFISEGRIAAACLLILLLPAFLNGGAGFFSDIKPYVRGGFIAFERLGDLLSTPEQPVAGSVMAGEGLAAGVPGVKGVRSITYSLLSYVAAVAGGRFFLLSFLQVLTAFFLLRTFVSVLGTDKNWLVPGVALAPGLWTSASAAAPDVWAGFVILGVALLAFAGAQMKRWWTLGIVLLTAFGVSSHQSHPPVAAACLGAAGIVLAIRAGSLRERLLPLVLPAAAVGLGVLATMATAFIGFGEVSVAPKRYPLTLARSIEDGPARWHLEENCSVYDYTVCRLFPEGMPSNIQDFLWAEGGIVPRSTPEQMDAMRAEEVVILRRAARDYPFFAIRRATANVIDQLFRFDLRVPWYKRRVSYEGGGEVSSARREAGFSTAILRALSPLHYGAIVALFGAGFVAYRQGWRPRRIEVEIAALLVAGCLVNAAICGVFSTPADRYQVRVIWLLPVSAALVLLPVLRAAYARK